MKFQEFLNETTSGKSAWEKYFKDNEVNTTLKKDAIVYNSAGERTPEIIPSGTTVKVLADTVLDDKKRSLLISVINNGKPSLILFSALKKPTTKGGEQLSIQSVKLLHTAHIETVNIGHKEFPAAIFTSSTELATVISNGINSMKTVPDDLKEILLAYLSQGNYSTIDWMGYDNKQFINEIAKYLGELMIGLIALNGEPLTKPLNQKMKNFIVPMDSSFAGIDSIFTTAKEEIISISSKSGAGAPASFHANIMPTLYKSNFPIHNPVLKLMIEVYKKNFSNLEWIYNVAFEYLLSKYLKRDKLGKDILRNPWKIYSSFLKGRIGEKELYLMDIVKNGKWPVMNNQKTIINKLPGSFTYFLCQNLAAEINSDKKALETILKVLGLKDFYQANLNKSKFHKGIVDFKILYSGSNKIKMIHGKGTMGSVASEQGRLSYKIY